MKQKTVKRYIIFAEFRMSSFDGWHVAVSRKAYTTYEKAEKDIPNYLDYVVKLSVDSGGLIICERQGAKARVHDIDVPLD